MIEARWNDPHTPMESITGSNLAVGTKTELLIIA